MIVWESEPESARKLSDEQLLAAWHRCDGEPGNSYCDALAGEIQRRGLDI